MSEDEKTTFKDLVLVAFTRTAAVIDMHLDDRLVSDNNLIKNRSAGYQALMNPEYRTAVANLFNKMTTEEKRPLVGVFKELNQGLISDNARMRIRAAITVVGMLDLAISYRRNPD